MIYTYNQCKEKFGSLYSIKKAIEAGELFKIEKGFYSNKPYESEIAIITLKYSEAVFTMNSAFYYHNLTDTIPEKYYLATGKNASKISDSRIIQKYENSDVLKLGLIEMEQDGAIIKIYNRERMLLELIRNKNNVPFDYYKEILNNYRKIINNLNIQTIQDYAETLPKNKMIMDTLRLEVF
ncbi:MAG: hypothetical protein HUJ68_02545 [Clostridia bacterium]|nr:hypothetical protein [Clostridia bacterium]